MIVIPCHYDPTRPMVQRCVASARRFMPDERVLVVDCQSPDQSYLEELPQDVERIYGANHFETGAWWAAYRQFPNERFFFCVHDSCEFLAPMYFVKDWKVGRMMGPSGWWGAKPHHMDWAAQQMRQHCPRLLAEIAATEDFVCTVGCMLFVWREVLDRLAYYDFDKVVPESKLGSQAMERAWGIALAAIGLDQEFARNKLCDFIDPSAGVAETKWLKKTWLLRGT